MSEVSRPYNLIQPLTIGNAINLGFHLYRSHLKLYSKLSLVAYLWLLVPIYGWAKFLAISALISRLVFCELMGQPESVDAALIDINRRMWNFLLTSILVAILTYVAMLISVALFFVGAFILALVVSLVLLFAAGLNSEKTGYWLGVLIGTLMLIIAPLSILWFSSRFFVANLPLATESNIRGLKTIKTSWNLTKGFISHIQGVIAITFLITLPILIIAWFVIGLSLGIIDELFIKDSVPDSVIYTVYIISIFFINTVITMPIWQSIKAVVYYNIRCHRESFDLQLRERSV